MNDGAAFFGGDAEILSGEERDTDETGYVVILNPGVTEAVGQDNILRSKSVSRSGEWVEIHLINDHYLHVTNDDVYAIIERRVA